MFDQYTYTPRPVVTPGAIALEAGDHIDALPSVETRSAQALVNLRLAVEPGVPGQALALVLVDAVDALAVEARVGVALVDVVLAVGAPRALERERDRNIDHLMLRNLFTIFIFSPWGSGTGSRLSGPRRCRRAGRAAGRTR